MSDSMFKISGDRPAGRIQKCLEQEATLRNSRGYPAWIQKELEAIWKIVNLEREKIGKPPVDIDRIQIAEISAQGHIDYTAKVGFYCEEIVYE